MISDTDLKAMITLLERASLDIHTHKDFQITKFYIDTVVDTLKKAVTA